MAQGSGLFWVFFGCVLLVVIAFLFYLRFQSRGTPAGRIALATCRGLLLALLFITLADPYLPLDSTSLSQPLLYVLFDGTQSMEIADEFSDDERTKLADAAGLSPDDAKEKRARLDYVKAMVARDDEQNFLRRLQDDKRYDVEAYVFDGATTSGVRHLKLAESGERLNPTFLADSLSATGQVTAMGEVVDALNGKMGKGDLAGVVMISDYAHNAGYAPVGDDITGRVSPVSRLQVPIYTVGIGATEIVNLELDVRPDVKMKRAERSSVSVRWSQSGLTGKTVTIEVKGRWKEGTAAGEEVNIGEETITLDDAIGTINLNFIPEESGPIDFIAKVDVQEGEILTDDNEDLKTGMVIDDHLNLMYVAYEPDWEWRFVKEVFHRDKLVGIEGFRTYLRSSDPKVRQYNDLFVPTLTPKRSEFFANDIIFIGDMPGSALSQRFCEMTKEFVTQFGGGLVVIAGPRFGPGQLAGTELADLLPVEVDATLPIRDQREFRMELTDAGQTEPFMRLGAPDNDAENAAAWQNLGAIPWYQPIKKPHPLATVLAVHPTDTCIDGETPQPLIAVRRFASGGKVVYIGFNELWRLRRKHGDLYYRQFWSQLMTDLALTHALGSEKRFVLRTDREQYNVDDTATVIVEAYDENFERLKPEKLADGKLTAELISPADGATARTISLTPLRDGEYEAHIPADVAGEWRVRVKDPIEEETREVGFRVANLSAERRRAQRNDVLQRQIAFDSAGESYDLADVGTLVDQLQLEPQVKHQRQIKPLWATPLWFILVVGLMLGEWFARKMNNMT